MFAGKDGLFPGTGGERCGLPTSRDARIARTPRSELSWESLARERARHPSSSRLSGSRVASRRKPGRFRNLEQRPWTGRASAHEHQRHSGDCGPARRREGRGWRKWGFRQRVGRQEVRVDARNAREATHYDPTDACRDGFFPHSLSDGIPFRSSPLRRLQSELMSLMVRIARARRFSRVVGENPRVSASPSRADRAFLAPPPPRAFSFRFSARLLNPLRSPFPPTRRRRRTRASAPSRTAITSSTGSGPSRAPRGRCVTPPTRSDTPASRPPPNPSFARKPRHREPTRSSRPRNFLFLGWTQPLTHPPPDCSRRCTRGSRTS